MPGLSLVELFLARLSKRAARYSAGVHLQRMGETMAPSFFSAANTLSTSLRSAPSALVTSPAETGLPASRMACNTCSLMDLELSEQPVLRTNALSQRYKSCLKRYIYRLTLFLVAGKSWFGKFFQRLHGLSSREFRHKWTLLRWTAHEFFL